HGDGDSVPTGALLQRASLELASALDKARQYVDSSLRASLQQFAKDLSVFVAQVLGVHRGASGIDALTTVRADIPQPPVAPASASAAPPPATAALAPAPAPQAETPTPDRVSFCASAPAQAQPGDEFVARFAAYLLEDEQVVRTTLAGSSDARLAT